MKLVLLGTAGGPTPKRRRAAPAQAIVVGGDVHVVDCGNGVGRQMALAGLDLRRLRHAFVTHHHSDHVADLVTLPLLAWASGNDSEVTLHGPPPLREAVAAGLRACAFDVGVRSADEGRRPLGELLRAHEMAEPGLAFQDERVTVTCVRVDHPPIRDAFAYRFDALGASIVISGDTAPSEALVGLARGADVLVHEVLLASEAEIASWLGEEASHPLVQHVARSHSHYERIGDIARRAGVRKLVLSHFVPGDADVDEARVAAAIRRDFGGEIVFGRDLLEIAP